MEIPTTMAECQQAIDAASLELTETTLHSRQVRDAEYEERIGLQTKARRIKLIRHTEHLSDMYRIFSAIRGRSQQDGLTRISVPRSWPPAYTHIKNIIGLPNPKAMGDPQLWKNVTKPEEIEYYLQLRNCFHFGQA
jgi:hypothetical protein